MCIIRIALIVSIVVFSVSSAIADAIDGDWCSPDEAKRVSISGPMVITPSGIQMTGNYTRHAFSYIAPSGEPEAGSTVSLQQLSEEKVRVMVGDGQPETWHRCQLNV